MKNPNAPRAAQRQRGMVLVTALLMLVVVTLLAVSMFRSFGLDEKIAGNVREKQRALSAAETAEEYAEWWLANGKEGAPVACSSSTAATTSDVGQVCTTVTGLTAPATLPWPTRIDYIYAPTTAFAMNTTTSGPSFLSQKPAYYVTFLGSTATSAMYQIDAVGYGGSADTTAVVEATYAISLSNKCLSC